MDQTGYCIDLLKNINFIEIYQKINIFIDLNQIYDKS
jgi:hypothetical protein